MGGSARIYLLRLVVPKLPVRSLGPLALTMGLSTMGVTMRSLTLTYLAFAQTGSALAAVGVMVGYTVAYALAAQPGSALLRRYTPRNAVLIVDALKVVSYSGTLLLQVLGFLNLPLIIAMNALGGVLSGSQYPAWQAILLGVSPEGKLDETNGVITSASAIGAAVGALAGGALLATLGAGVPFAVNVVTFLPLMVVISRLPAEVGSQSQETEGGRVSIAKLWGILRRNPPVQIGILFTALLELIALPIVSLLPKVAADFGSSPHIYGILLGGFYFGGVLVAGALVMVKQALSYRAIMSISLASIGLALVFLAGIGFLPLGVPLSVASSALLLVVLGAVLGMAASILGAITQLSADPEIRGPVMAFYASVALGAGAAGGLVEGWIADILQIWWLPLASGALILAALTYLWFRHDFRALDEADPGLEQPARHHAASRAHFERHL